MDKARREFIRDKIELAFRRRQQAGVPRPQAESIAVELWDALSAAESRIQELEATIEDGCRQRDTLWEQVTEWSKRFNRSQEAFAATLRGALTVRLGGRLQCRGCYAYLDGADRHTEECWAAPALSSTPAESLERLRMAERAIELLRMMPKKQAGEEAAIAWLKERNGFLSTLEAEVKR